MFKLYDISCNDLYLFAEVDYYNNFWTIRELLNKNFVCSLVFSKKYYILMHIGNENKADVVCLQ